MQVEEYLVRDDRIVLPVGWSLCFTGWETERLRSLFFHWNRNSPNTPYHLGMLNSTKREHPYYPIAASR